MARSIDLFIGSRRPPDEVAAEVQNACGLTLHPGAESETWELHEGGVEALLRTHEYLDDGDLWLSRFPLTLSCRLDAGTRVVDAAETALLRLVGESLRKHGIPTMLVHDLQYRDNPSPASEVTSVPEAAVAEDPDGVSDR